MNLQFFMTQPHNAGIIAYVTSSAVINYCKQQLLESKWGWLEIPSALGKAVSVDHLDEEAMKKSVDVKQAVIPM